MFRHVDGVLAKLEVDAREIAAQQGAAKALSDAPVEDWTKDPSLSGYPRPQKPRNKGRGSAGPNPSG